LTTKSGHGERSSCLKGAIYLVPLLNPTRGSEIRKTWPCVVISQDELNAHLRSFIVAPLTTGGHPSPFCVRCRFDDKHGHIVAERLRAVDRDRLIRHLGVLADDTLLEVLSILQAMFAV
jgi:mRNA interferase MazF